MARRADIRLAGRPALVTQVASPLGESETGIFVKRSKDEIDTW